LRRSSFERLAASPFRSEKSQSVASSRTPLLLQKSLLSSYARAPHKSGILRLTLTLRTNSGGGPNISVVDIPARRALESGFHASGMQSELARCQRAVDK